MRYAFCVRNDGCEDLVLGKTYKVLDDPKSEAKGYIRVIDESDEDYIYPKSGFHIAEQ